MTTGSAVWKKKKEHRRLCLTWTVILFSSFFQFITRGMMPRSSQSERLTRNSAENECARLLCCRCCCSRTAAQCCHQEHDAERAVDMWYRVPPFFFAWRPAVLHCAALRCHPCRLGAASGYTWGPLNQQGGIDCWVQLIFFGFFRMNFFIFFGGGFVSTGFFF